MADSNDSQGKKKFKMKTLVINDFFVNNIFFPFLIVCLFLGLLSFGLTIVHYFVCRFEEIKEKENSINEVFLSIKNFYKKELVVLEEFVNEIEGAIEDITESDIF